MIPMNFMKSKAGFTLVELIVVIAILGILAGIAVPAYSGYIKKANGASDTQVLAAANTALAASMTENLLAPSDAATYVKLTSSNANDDTAGCSVTLEAVTSGNETAAAIISDFADYYGASTIEFKYYDTIPATGTITADGTIVVSE